MALREGSVGGELYFFSTTLGVNGGFSGRGWSGIQYRSSMRALILDHYFIHDLSALENAKGKEDRFLVMRYSYLRDRFLDFFPSEVLGSEFSLYSSSVYRVAREGWSAWSQREALALMRLWRPDLFVLPSDTFPYVRDLVRAFQKLNVPTVVVQKETTIAPDTMENHSRAIGRYFPFISDHMTVCSDHHRQFWLYAGADPSRVSVTGQPRFDLYAYSRAKCNADLPVTILFFSFMTDAYVPAKETDRHVWKELLCEIERALVRSAIKAGVHVIVKPHPQQPPEQIQECRERLIALDPLGEYWSLVDGELDARQLICDAKAVVGFQTTALMESCLAGKPTFYCCWGAAHKALASGLIPYEDGGDAIQVLRSGEELERNLARVLAQASDKEPLAVPALVGTMLGPCDGQASDRVLELWREKIEEGRLLANQSRGQSVGFEGWHRELPNLIAEGLRLQSMSSFRGQSDRPSRIWTRLCQKRSRRLLGAIARRAFGADESAAFARAYR